MSKTYVTVYAIRVANFETLISFVASYGVSYKSNNVAIQLVSLETKTTDAKQPWKL